jgi:hypothetical protein
MSERLGWWLACIGAAILILGCIGGSVFAFLWASAFMERIFN